VDGEAGLPLHHRCLPYREGGLLLLDQLQRHLGVVGQLEGDPRPVLRRELPLQSLCLPPDGRSLPLGSRRLPLEDLLQLLLQVIALLRELDASPA
jgi:hypothetical protein